VAPAIETNLYTLQLTPRPDAGPTADTIATVQMATTRRQAAAQTQAAEPKPPVTVRGHNTPTLPVLGKRARTPAPAAKVLPPASELQAEPTADAVEAPPHATTHCPKLWHRRFAHLHPDALRTVTRGVISLENIIEK
jgi:hypothetical protein